MRGTRWQTLTADVPVPPGPGVHRTSGSFPRPARFVTAMLVRTDTISISGSRHVIRIVMECCPDAERLKVEFVLTTKGRGLAIGAGLADRLECLGAVDTPIGTVTIWREGGFLEANWTAPVVENVEEV